MAETPSKDSKLKKSKHDFYFEVPLYEIVRSDDMDAGIFSGDVDAYSAQNKIDTTYKISAMRISDNDWDDFHDFYRVTLECKRKEDDVLCFVVYTNGEAYMKIGQLPSLASIQFAAIGKKYDKLLSREDVKEFKRAIGLAANGVGVGSFVYLRRIFEKLIINTYTEHQTEIIQLSRTEFLTKRMEEKIEVLKIYLPSQLIEMKAIYSILSKGVHELSEQECLGYFGALKLSIELILDQQIEHQKKAQRDKAVKKQIQEISNALVERNSDTM